MNTSSINKNSLLATIIFHIIVVLLLLFLALRVPLPLPGEKGILVNFGTTDDGAGVNEPQQEQQQVPKQQEKVEQTNLTQDFEEAPVIKQIDKNKPKQEEQKTQQTQKTEEQRTVNQNALFPGNQNSNNQSEGESTGIGNQGNPDGDPNALSHQGNPDGGGNSYNLGGRGLKGALPRPVYPGNEQGKVVVEIYVDRYGNVVKANAGIKGSTILSKPYLDAALQAAMRAKFDAKPDAPELQRGTITYRFSLQ
ncbi:MAG: energy transducer TonB [Bacteroidales bacterium]|nr:energy transducer TonB [Bacteroidales bacterium]